MNTNKIYSRFSTLMETVTIQDGKNKILFMGMGLDTERDCTEREKQCNDIVNAYNNYSSLLNDNEELKARCDTYKKDYESLVKEIVRLSGENSKMKELIADRIKELEG